MILPRLIILKSLAHSHPYYMQYMKSEDEYHGLLQFFSHERVTAYTKFEVERPQNEAAKQAGFIHIRCSYNNKYLVCQDGYYIAAASDEAEEDQSKSSCTLFEPSYSDSYKAYRLRHVQLGYYLTHKFNYILHVEKGSVDEGSSEDILSTYSSIIDWDKLCILPRYVAFKNNGKFLKCYDYDGNLYLQFGASDVTNELVGHEVLPEDIGSGTIGSEWICIRSTHWNFWRRDPDWIKADSNQSDIDKGYTNNIFCPVKVDTSGTNKNIVIALRNKGNNFFCRSLTADDKESCLNASAETITDEAKMEVYEYVISREIYNVRFQTKDARLYGVKPQTMATKTSVNNTNESVTSRLALSYEKSKSSTWQTTMGMSLGVTTTMSTGVPLIAEAEIEISAEISTEYSFGETYVETEVVSTEIEFTVPPNSERRVSMVAIHGQCDIPFSYTQKDYVATGKIVITEKNDGLYSGLNYYSFQEVVDDPRSLII